MADTSFLKGNRRFFLRRWRGIVRMTKYVK